MEALKYKPLIHEQNNKISTPYSKATTEYDCVLEAARDQARKWRIMAFALLAVTFLAVGGLIAIKSLREQKVLYVDVAAWGEARLIGDIAETKNGLNEISSASKDFYLKKFLRSIRELSTDPRVVETNINTAYRYVTQQGAQLLTAMLEEIKIKENFGKYRIEILSDDIESITKVMQNTYQIDWIETSMSLMGGNVQKYRYRGMFILYFDTEKKPTSINPLNIYIDEFEIDRIGEIR